jgi:hypothetical protein
MSLDPSSGSSEGDPSAPTVNESDPTQISALARHRSQGSPIASSAQEQDSPQEGETGTNPGSAEREQFIPRDRFDEVNNQKNLATQQLAAQTAMMQQMMAQQAAQQQHVAGMVGAPQAQPQQQQAPVFDPSDPEVQKQWREKLAANPIEGMAGFFQEMLQAQGAPMISQLRNEMAAQMQPLRDGYVQQQVEGYAQQRMAQDPTFAQVAPQLNAVVQNALQQRPDLQLNPQILQIFEQIARTNSAGQQFGNPPAFGMAQPGIPPMQPGAPFSERPAAVLPGGTGQANAPITPQIRAMAQRFGQDPQVYANKARDMNSVR